VPTGGKLDGEVTRVHRLAIPFQLETQGLLSYSRFRKRIWPEIVPLLTHPVASLAYSSSLPPAESMSCFIFCSLCYASEEAIDSHSVPDSCKEQALSVCPYLQHS
jgi:hypothetical protein